VKAWDTPTSKPSHLDTQSGVGGYQQYHNRRRRSRMLQVWQLWRELSCRRKAKKTVHRIMSSPMLRSSEEPYTLHGEIEHGRATIRSTRSNYTSNDVLEDLGTKAWRDAHGYEHEIRTSLSLNLPGLTKCRAGPSRSNRVPSTRERFGRKFDHKIPNE
jgi:hypothetical protein